MSLFPAPAPDIVTVLAGHGRRLAAALLDAVFYAVTVGAFGVAGFLVGLAGAATTDGRGNEYDGWEELGWILLGSIVGLFLGFVAWVVLTVWLVRRPGPRNGQTLGKQITGIRVARANGGRVDAWLALGRELCAKWVLIGFVSVLISALLGFLDGGSLGFLIAVVLWYVPSFFDDQRRALHDRICSTRVVAAAPAPAPVQPAADDLWPAVP